MGAIEGFEASPVRLAEAEEGFENRENEVEVELPLTRKEDIIVEKTKVITKVRYTRGEEVTEYMKVYHKWGGSFYFKNGKSCSQQVFELETHGNDMAAVEE